MAQDFKTASLVGINVDRVTSFAFSLSGALAAFVGVLAGVYYNAVNPGMGFVPGLKGFTAAVFDGITSIPGAILGGYLLGIIENLGVQFISSGYRDLIAFVILIVFLLFRPNGILGKKTKALRGTRMEMLKKIETHKVPLSVLGGILILALPFILGNPYLVRIATMVAIYVVLASSLNLIIGFTGMYSLGHGAFYGIGAYTSAILAVNLKWSFWITMPLAGIMAALVGAFIGLATLRLRQTFLVFGTLAFGEIVRILIMNWDRLTRGPMGIPGIPVPTLFGPGDQGPVELLLSHPRVHGLHGLRHSPALPFPDRPRLGRDPRGRSGGGHHGDPGLRLQGPRVHDLLPLRGPGRGLLRPLRNLHQRGPVRHGRVLPHPHHGGSGRDRLHFRAHRGLPHPHAHP